MVQWRGDEWGRDVISDDVGWARMPTYDTQTPLQIVYKYMCIQI